MPALNLNAALDQRLEQGLRNAISKSLVNGTKFWENSMLKMLRAAAEYLPQSSSDAASAMSGIVRLYENICGDKTEVTLDDLIPLMLQARAAEAVTEPYIAGLINFAVQAGDIVEAAFNLATARTHNKGAVEGAIATCKMKVNCAITHWVSAACPDDDIAWAYRSLAAAQARLGASTNHATNDYSGAGDLPLAQAALEKMRTLEIVRQYEAGGYLSRRFTELAALLGESDSS